MEPGDVHHKHVKPRPEDAEKSLRQRMGIDGDAIEEERQAEDRAEGKEPERGPRRPE